MKLIVRQISGLGNQMFQYAAGRFYSHLHAAQMSIAIAPPNRSTSHGHGRPFLLRHFNIATDFCELNRIENLMLLSVNPRLAHIRPMAAAVLRAAGIQIVAETIDQRFRFQPQLQIDRGARTVYLLGYWQVHNIADAISDDLRREFSFRDPPSGKNLELLRKIENTECPVSVHIRRGDYTLQIEGNVALSPDYYVRSMASMRQFFSHPIFHVFSDDMEFARRRFGGSPDIVFVDHNDANTAHEDLRLMTACRHHIIANSTFSWWGAWLSAHQDKLVIAPRSWLVGRHSRYDDLVPPQWLKLD